MNSKTRIEIEFRARFNEDRYKELELFLDKNAKDLGGDDKDVFFFIMVDKLLKVVNNISKKNATLVLKLNKIGQGSDFEELEIPIAQRDVNKAVKMFTALGVSDNIMRSFQKRHNYLYKGVELALKYSDVWGYHLELEILLNDISEKQKAENKIKVVAKELNIRLMTEQELTDFTQKAEQAYRNQKSKQVAKHFISSLGHKNGLN